MRHRRPRIPAVLRVALPLALLALALAGAPAAHAADGDTAAVPIGEIAVRAEETQASLRRLQPLTVTPLEVTAIERELGTVREQITQGLGPTEWLLESRPSFPGLERLVAPWERARKRLGDWNVLLTKRATLLQEEIDRLEAFRQRWTATRAEARRAAAPPQVVARVDELIAAIGQAEKLVRAQRGTIVLLQDRVAAETGRCDQVLARLDSLRNELIAGVFDRGGVPVWDPEFRAAWWPAMRQGLADTGPLLLRGFGYITRRRPAFTAAYGVALIVLFVLLWRSERAPAVQTALGQRAPSLGAALRRSFAGAWLAALLVMWLADPTGGSPVDPRELTLVVPVTLLLAGEVGRRWRLMLYAFGALFAVDRLRNALWRQPMGEQGLLLLEVLAAIGLAAWFLAARRPVPGAGAPRRWSLLDAAARVLVAVWIVAFVAGAAGYLSVASLLGGGAVSSAYLALAFHGIVLVATRLAALALHASPIMRLQAVRHRPALVLEKTRALLVWAAAGTWAWVTLDAEGLLESTLRASRALLGTRLLWGAIDISLGDMLAFGLTVWAAFLVSAIVRFFLEEDVFQHIGLKRGVPYALSRLLHYAILVAGFTIGVGALGVDLNKVTVLAGAFGVGIGFGLQNLVSNFVSGLILLMERPIQVGDAVQLGEIAGEVQQIGMRASTVRTWDGAEVIVPNSQLVSEKVVNWTLSDRTRRLTLKIGIAYGNDPGRVIELLQDTAIQHPRARRQPAPVAVFRGFGESGLDFELWVWIDRYEEGPMVQSELGVAINAALGAAKIDIAFPQRVIHVRGGGAGPATIG